ncbi:hypothetical protein [Chengkuizengella axinellae]|uniref:Uncharacterized protein n=1 Tax=Chengkuizengella axinellae TaxID=3064388 RepID=A0ABT9IWG5_9BACL|nr:hypothetical protein [Chengkuizengella sp. 2205SS18-9]MDP5273678.1 hypothetical protein [Chengkuizengella sp. 2205SS18-9]
MEQFEKQRLIEEYQKCVDEMVEAVNDNPELLTIHEQEIDRIKMKLEQLKEVE